MFHSAHAAAGQSSTQKHTLRVQRAFPLTLWLESRHLRERVHLLGCVQRGGPHHASARIWGEGEMTAQDPGRVLRARTRARGLTLAHAPDRFRV